MADDFDAVVIGSGINGMVAAAELGKAGWSVALLERNSEIGGFVAAGERTLPGYVHDTYSSWYPLFVSSPAYAALGADLARHGLEFRNTDGAVTASVSDDGVVSVAYRDAVATAAEFAKAEDGRRYLELLQRFQDNADHFGGFMGTDLRRFSTLSRVGRFVRRNGRRGSEAWLRDIATSGRSFCRREFTGNEVDHLWAPWLLHSGLSPDHASGGMMIPVFAATLHGFGLPVVAGGAGNLVTAFRNLFDEIGVHVHTDTSVDRILVESGRAAGVQAGGRTFRARRSVLASVTPTALYGSLLPADRKTADLREQARAYRYGRGEMQVHVALSEPLRWNDPRLDEIPLVHITAGSSSTAIACAEAEAGLLPQRPTVVVGQQALLDPSRVPVGAGSLWLQLQEVPFEPRGDARGELDATQGWTPDLARAYAQRALDRVAAHTDDLASRVLAVDVIAPPDLFAYNVNAVAGDPYGGSSELDQSFVWRPLPSSGSHSTPITGLWHIGASTHPGAGLGAGSGHLVATTLTSRRSIRK